MLDHELICRCYHGGLPLSVHPMIVYPKASLPVEQPTRLINYSGPWTDEACGPGIIETNRLRVS
jgi:hypothetical protein